MEDQDPLTQIRLRLHKCLDKILIKDFGSMNPTQLLQYRLSNPEDKRVEDYILRLCSSERQREIQIEVERLEQSRKY